MYHWQCLCVCVCVCVVFLSSVEIPLFALMTAMAGAVLDISSCQWHRLPMVVLTNIHSMIQDGQCIPTPHWYVWLLKQRHIAQLRTCLTQVMDGMFDIDAVIAEARQLEACQRSILNKKVWTTPDLHPTTTSWGEHELRQRLLSLRLAIRSLIASPGVEVSRLLHHVQNQIGAMECNTNYHFRMQEVANIGDTLAELRCAQDKLVESVSSQIARNDRCMQQCAQVVNDAHGHLMRLLLTSKTNMTRFKDIYIYIIRSKRLDVTFIRPPLMPPPPPSSPEVFAVQGV